MSTVSGYETSVVEIASVPLLGLDVMAAPADALEFAKLVTGSMFAIGGASSLVAGLAHAWKQRA
jgi:hypothetical protein